MESQSSVTLTPPQPMVAHEICQQAIMDALLEAIPVNLMPETLQVVPIFRSPNRSLSIAMSGLDCG
jgi:hypothetical protein